VSIHEIRPGVWAVRWREGGRNRERAIGRKRDAEAVDAQIKRLKRLGLLAAVDAGRLTLAEFGKEWWRRRAARLTAKTRTGYAALWDAHVLPRLGDLRLRDLTPAVMEDWLAGMEKDGVGREAQRKALKLLRGVLQRAVEWDELQRNPARLVPLPRPPETPEVRPLPPEDVEGMRAFLVGQRRERDALLISVLAYAGLRPEEANGLTWGHVRERTLLIEQVASMGRIEVRSKTRQARAVRLLGPVAQDLAEYRLRVGRPEDRELIFPAADGRPRSDAAQNNWRRRVFNEARRAAGVKRATPYYLRHSFASLLIWEGQPIPYVAQQLGHSPMMTLRTYAHVIEEYEGAERVPADVAIRAARESLGKKAV
jgi:integrase